MRPRDPRQILTVVEKMNDRKKALVIRFAALAMQLS